MVSSCHHTHLPLSVSFNYRLREHFKEFNVVIYEEYNYFMMPINSFPLQFKYNFAFSHLQNCYSGNYLKERLQQMNKDNEKFNPIIGKLMWHCLGLDFCSFQLFILRLQLSNQWLKFRLPQPHCAKHQFTRHIELASELSQPERN